MNTYPYMMLVADGLSFLETRAFRIGLIIGVILLYILATVYNRIKRPRKGIQEAKVKIESIDAVRVKMDGGSMVLDNMRNDILAKPGSRFVVTFSDDIHNETYEFNISEELCGSLREGDRGVLRYKGDQFISYDKR